MTETYPVPPKLEDLPLWVNCRIIAEEAYAVLPEFPEEEKWGMCFRLRKVAFDLTGDLAEAVGTLKPKDAEYSLGLARKSLYSIKNVYVMAHRTGILPINPDKIVLINKVIGDINREITRAQKAIEQAHKEEVMKSAKALPKGTKK